MRASVYHAIDNNLNRSCTCLVAKLCNWKMLFIMTGYVTTNSDTVPTFNTVYSFINN